MANSGLINIVINRAPRGDEQVQVNRTSDFVLPGPTGCCLFPIIGTHGCGHVAESDSLTDSTITRSLKQDEGLKTKWTITENANLM